MDLDEFCARVLDEKDHIERATGEAPDTVFISTEMFKALEDEYKSRFYTVPLPRAIKTEMTLCGMQVITLDGMQKDAFAVAKLRTKTEEK